MEMIALKGRMQFGSDWTSSERSVQMKGYITNIILTLPNFKNDVTGTLSIHDQEDNELWNSGPQKKGQVYFFQNLRLPVLNEFRIKCRLSGAPGADADAGLHYFVDTF